MSDPRHRLDPADSSTDLAEELATYPPPVVTDADPASIDTVDADPVVPAAAPERYEPPLELHMPSGEGPHQWDGEIPHG